MQPNMSANDLLADIPRLFPINLRQPLRHSDLVTIELKRAYAVRAAFSWLQGSYWTGGIAALILS